MLKLYGEQVINESSIIYGFFFHLFFFLMSFFLCFFFKKMTGYQNNLQKLDMVRRLSQTSMSFSQKDQ